MKKPVHIARAQHDAQVALCEQYDLPPRGVRSTIDLSDEALLLAPLRDGIADEDMFSIHIDL